MKKLFVNLIFILVSFVTHAQFPAPQPPPLNKDMIRVGKLFWLNTSDTTEFSASSYRGAIMYRAADKSLYVSDSTRWVQVASGGDLSEYMKYADTTSLSSRIDQKLDISDTTDMLSSYLRKVDTTGKWKPLLWFPGVSEVAGLQDSLSNRWSLNGNTVSGSDTLGTNNNHPIRLKSSNQYVGQIGSDGWVVNPLRTSGSLLFVRNQDTSITATGAMSIYKPRFGSTTNASLAGISLYPRSAWTNIAADGPVWHFGFSSSHPRGYAGIFGRDESGNTYPAITINTNFHVGIGRVGTTTIVDPTAYLHLAPGVDTVPALKLSAGAILNTPQLGAFEYRNVGADSALYFTLNAERRKFAFQADPFYSGTLSPTAIARYYSGEYITDHAHYAFLANDSVNFSGIGVQGRAAFNDNSKFVGSANPDHIHSFQAFPHWSGTGTLARLTPFWAFAEVNSGTVTELSMFKAHQPAGSGTVTNLYGLYVQQLTKGANNWAVWADGNTPSFFGGNVGIGTSGNLTKLHVLTNNTSGFAVQNSAVISSSSGGFVRLYQSGTPSASDHRIGGVLAATNPTGSTVRVSGQIDFSSEDSWTDGSSHPTYLRFWTTPLGSTTIAERMRISAGGNVGINTTGATARLDVNGTTGYNQLRLRTAYTPTSSADSNGNTGDVSWDDNYIYIKTSAGWKRSTLTTF